MNDKNIAAIMKSLQKAKPKPDFEERVMENIRLNSHSSCASAAFFKTAKTSLITVAFLAAAIAVINFIKPDHFSKTGAIEDVHRYVLSDSCADNNINKYILG
ncbi:MAG: hypothetical protein LBQ47_08805 [Endomicrobium sp.]|jgi:hypothetical protein|nr:hypothetical protein [Endomicrobium sp.]